MLLSLCFINNDLEGKSFYKIVPINIQKSIECTTDIFEVKDLLTIPTNSYISLNAIAEYQYGVPKYISILVNGRSRSFNINNYPETSEDAIKYALSTSLNIFEKEESTISVYLKYNINSLNIIYLTGFYIQKLE